MTARDLFHNAVKQAFAKAGWTITHDPLSLQVGGVEMYIDLGAERLLTAENEGAKIAVEIKSFLRVSALYEFHLAIGQYRNIQLALLQEDPERRLFLAVPEDAYDRFFITRFVQDALQFNTVSYFVYDVQKEVVVRWQPMTSTAS